ASRLSGARFRAEQKKEHQAPPNYARPCHSGEGRHAKNTLVQNSKRAAACRYSHSDCRMHLTTLWQCLPRLETGNLLAKSMGKVFVRATRPILPAASRECWPPRKVAANWPRSNDGTLHASRLRAHEHNLELFLGDDLIVDAGEPIIHRIIVECIGRTVVAGGP